MHDVNNLNCPANAGGTHAGMTDADCSCPEKVELNSPIQLNKTFLLTANAAHTEGSMLIVIDSLDNFVMLFKEYHTQKCDFMTDNVPEYYMRINAQDHDKWHDICEKERRLEKQFIKENNNKPFDFEFSTGCDYIKTGKGKGWFYRGVRIAPDKKTAVVWKANFLDHTGHWEIVKEFLSDLPIGTHYCGDYCS
jgi:hypothetical protein